MLGVQNVDSGLVDSKQVSIANASNKHSSRCSEEDLVAFTFLRVLSRTGARVGDRPCQVSIN